MNGGTPKIDQRGKHNNRPNKILENIQAVKTHIETFPRYISQYSSKDNPERVSFPELRLYDLYAMFADQMGYSQVEG